MLIDQQLKKRIWRLLLSATMPAAGPGPYARGVGDDSLPRLNRGGGAQSAVSRLEDTASWMSSSLLLTATRTASGV